MIIKKISDYNYIYSGWKSLGAIYCPPLDKRIVNFHDYISKIHKNGITYAVTDKNILLGMISFYANDTKLKNAFISQIIVNQNMQKNGIGKLLIQKCEEVCKNYNMQNILLEVRKNNSNAISFYKKMGFIIDNEKGSSYFMIKKIGKQYD